MVTRLENRESETYICIKEKGARSAYHRLALPVTVGSSGNCDIVIASEQMAPCAYAIYQEAGDLVVGQVSTGNIVARKVLSDLNLKCIGPIQAADGKLGPLKCKMREFAKVEQELFEKLPPAIQRMTGKGLGEKRLAVWAACISLLLGTMLLWPAQNQAVTDFHDSPIALGFDTVMVDTIGASLKRRGYEKGILFHIDGLPKMLPSDGGITLNFEGVGFRHSKEITVEFNGQAVYETEFDPECVFAFCSHQVSLDGSLVNENLNSLRFVHHVPNSPYFIKNVHVRMTPVLSEMEKVQVTRWLELAKRAFDMVNIAEDNLLTAKSHLRRSLQLLENRKGGADLKLKGEALLNDVERAWEEQVKELWTKVHVSMQLERFPAAERQLQVLLRLHPDPSSAEHQRIIRQLDLIREAIQ